MKLSDYSLDTFTLSVVLKEYFAFYILDLFIFYVLSLTNFPPRVRLEKVAFER